ncbi:MAG TPA: ThiF family adenylyltransferase, partial [Isosphaeraceae bacterium]|nr:ThiF family adenylyltransferase [Isosphaeraceae bacterium]
LALDRDLVTTVNCPRCDWETPFFRPRTKVRQDEAICPICREPGRPEMVSAIAQDSPLAVRSLAEVGVPPYDIVRVDGASESGFFLLAADRPTAPEG